jgi:predicted  nucleic acid-binding Zn-ribbon protein
MPTVDLVQDLMLRITVLEQKQQQSNQELARLIARIDEVQAVNQTEAREIKDRFNSLESVVDALRLDTAQIKQSLQTLDRMSDKLDGMAESQTATDKKITYLLGWGGGIGAAVLFLLNYGERIIGWLK